MCIKNVNNLCFHIYIYTHMQLYIYIYRIVIASYNSINKVVICTSVVFV